MVTIKDGIYYALESLGIKKPTPRKKYDDLKFYCLYKYRTNCTNKYNPNKKCGFAYCPLKNNFDRFNQ